MVRVDPLATFTGRFRTAPFALRTSTQKVVVSPGIDSAESRTTACRTSFFATRFLTSFAESRAGTGSSPHRGSSKTRVIGERPAVGRSPSVSVTAVDVTVT